MLMENEKEFTPEESISLIRDMISKTKDSVADDSFYFLLWGWLVFSCCIGAFVLKVLLHYPHHYYVWWLIPLGGVASWIYGSRQAKKQRVKSFVEESLDHLWIAVGLAFFALVIINIISGTSWQTAFTYYILLYAIGTFVTGRLLRFKPLVYGSLVNFVLAVLSIRYSYDYQLLICATALLFSYIIPGHLLRLRYQKQKHNYA